MRAIKLNLGYQALSLPILILLLFLLKIKL